MMFLTQCVEDKYESIFSLSMLRFAFVVYRLLCFLFRNVFSSPDATPVGGRTVPDFGKMYHVKGTFLIRTQYIPVQYTF